MNVLFDITNVVGVILEILIALSFFNSISHKKQITKTFEVILAISLMILQSFVIINVKTQGLVTLVLFLIIIGISFVYKISIFKRFIFSIVLMMLLLLSEMIIGLVLTMILSVSVERLSSEVLFYMQGVLVSKLLVFVMIRIVELFSVKSEERISRFIYIMLITLPVTTFLVVYVLSEYTYASQDGRLLNLSALAVIFLIISNILIFYLFEYQLKIAEIQKQEELLKQQLEYKAEYYKELSDRQQITNKTMHDIKNQLFALRDIYKNNPEQGMGKIETICADILSAYTLKYTGIEPVDALITSKMLMMKENDIEFINSIYISKDCNIDIMDMCVVLGNVLDNSIEANMNYDGGEKYIRLNISQQMDYLSMSISNPTNRVVKIDNNRILSTKKQKELHGFGLKSVNEIVNKYDGNCTFKQENNKFDVFIMLKNG